MLRTSLIVCVASVLIVFLVIFLRYRAWSKVSLDQLDQRSQIAQTDLGPIEYVLKTGDDNPQQTILFLHGSPGGYNQAPQARPGYRILAPSRPGYLRTPLNVEANVAFQADSYASLLDTLDISSVVVMGGSGGGPSAIAFAALHSDRTTALVLLEAVSQPMEIPPVPSIMQSDLSYWMFLTAMTKISGVQGMVKMFVPDQDNQQRILQNPEKLNRFESMVWSTWPLSKRIVGWQNDYTQILGMNLSPTLIEAPTLIIHGTADRSVPTSQSEALKEKIPHAELHLIKGADHMMPVTHSDEIDSLITEFLIGGRHS